MKRFKQLATAFSTFAFLSMANVAMAAGVDTGSSSLNSLKTWMMTWIPIAATILIIVTAIAWMAHMLRHDVGMRIVLGLIVIGSASYLVGLFGLN